MSAFRYTFYAQEVIFGPGSIARLGEAVERMGWRRLMLCTTEHMRGRGHLAPVEQALGSRLVATYERVQPHVRASLVDEALGLADAHGVDAVIGLGGGSPIGTAKAVSMGLEERRAGRPAGAGLPTDHGARPTTTSSCSRRWSGRHITKGRCWTTNTPIATRESATSSSGSSRRRCRITAIPPVAGMLSAATARWTPKRYR